MDKQRLILADVLTFGLIAFVGALFGASHSSPDVVLTGRVVCYVAVVLAALAVFVKRPPSRFP